MTTRKSPAAKALSESSIESNEKVSREGVFVGFHIVEEGSRCFWVPLRGTGKVLVSGLVIVRTGAMFAPSIAEAL